MNVIVDIIFWFENNEAAQFYFWEYINRNQTFLYWILTGPPLQCLGTLYQDKSV